MAQKHGISIRLLRFRSAISAQFSLWGLIQGITFVLFTQTVLFAQTVKATDSVNPATDSVNPATDSVSVESLPQFAPVALASSPDKQFLYAACSDRLSDIQRQELHDKSTQAQSSLIDSGGNLLVFRWTEPLILIRRIPLPGRPTGLCSDAKGNVYATVAQPDASSQIVCYASRYINVSTGNAAPATSAPTISAPTISGPAASDFEQKYCIDAGHAARAPIVVEKPNGCRSLFFCRQFKGELIELDAETGSEIRSWTIGREPYCCTAPSDGRTLVVGHLMPDSDYTPWYYPGRVTLLNTETGELRAAQLPDGTSGLFDIAISPDERFAVAVHTLGQHEHVTSSLNMGWIINNVISLVDLQTGKYVYTLYLDMPQCGLANPNCLKFSLDGNWLYVLLGGRHELIRIEWRPTFKRLIQDYPLPSSGPRVGAVSPALDFHSFVKLHGQGPQTLLVREKTEKSAPNVRRQSATGPIIPRDELVVGLFFSSALESLDFSSLPGRVNNTSNLRIENYNSSNYIVQPRWSYVSLQTSLDAKRLSAELPIETQQILRGEKAFADASRAYQGWVSCISCHHDGRTDGLRWDLLNDGVGNPKSAKSMLLSHKTSPSMVRAVRPTAESAVRAGFTHLLECDPIESDCQAIDAYLSHLTPVPSPYLVEKSANNESPLTSRWQLSDKAKRGKRLFIKAGCSGCHSGQNYTDQKRHDVGVYSPDDPDGLYDTPTLIEVWRTGPYLHDNSAARIRNTFVAGHGSAAQLSEEEREALEEYVLSL